MMRHAYMKANTNFSVYEAPTLVAFWKCTNGGMSGGSCLLPEPYVPKTKPSPNLNNVPKAEFGLYSQLEIRAISS
jgi:hypothetical protein